ncbi:patched domain-containing protein 3-like [Mizuhopecten yessoensis]|uniref:Patched domain-containing protein 3 n=1 Tax=Mizuhopecten yessoensis TaxID=6573 RepID=A0A210QPV2_MIZYE|nr:patched domain-containing protein 3-like [Mizuhopecten yessoensis]XP_021352985.1 patched domain-containing protein 3-like [Mizuhopecten yessoensis]OWF50770.1 Patched domain-containing protein 3 [Mizuhopecten yessoensis]
MVCWKVYNKVERVIGNFFARYGELVGTYPWTVLTVSVLVSGLLGIGLVNLTFESDVEKVYTPSDSQASQDRSTIKNIFDDDSGANFYSQSLVEANLFGTVIFESKNASNLLTVPYIHEIQSIYDQAITNVLGNRMNYSQLCAVRGSKCVVDGDIIFSANFGQLLVRGNITYPLLGNISLESIFGDVIIQRGVLQSAKFIKLVFNLRQDTTDSRDNSKLWEKDFVSHLQNIQSTLLDVTYAHSKSLDEELTSNISGDILFVSLTFTLMIVYATFVSMKCDCLLDRQNLGRAGVTTTGLGILASFGLVSACGVEFVDIVGVMPFLVLGIGIDDMFILLAGLAEAPLNETPAKRVAETMRTSGVAITITSLTDIIAFSVGASSVFPGVRNFCIYTGIAVLFCYLNFVTFFIACIAINERRVSAEKHCCLCCHTIEMKDKMGAASRLRRFCCGGTALTSVSDMQSLLERLPGQILIKFITLTPVKIITLISFAVYLGVAIWGATNFKQGLDTTNLVSDDSYYFTYNLQNRKHFLQRIPVSFVIDGTLDYSKVSTVNSIDSLMTHVQNDKTVGNNNLVISWFDSFRSSPVYNNTSESQFVTNLKLFLDSNEEFKNDVRFDSTSLRIRASRVYVLTNNLVDSTEQGDFMLRMRSLTEDSSLHVIAYSPSFIFYEQYVAILPSTLQTVGIAVAVIFVVTALFMPSPLLILYVTVSMVMIMTGIFGFMYFWDLTLSSITMIHVIMSVGFSVDFSAHICHAFMTVEGSTRDEKVKNAILRSGGPIWNGAISSIIGIIMLVFSKSYIFRSFFRVMLLVILFGVGHATFFLPVVLSLIGPMENTKSDSKSVSDMASMSSRLGHSNPGLHTDEENKSPKQISLQV